MACLGAMGSELGLKLLLSPAGTGAVVRAACTGIGVGFPVYATFKAIEKKDAEEQEQWLVYWTAYGCFNIVELFSDALLSWFPYYHHAKFAFLIWLQFPFNYGAKHLYRSVLKPFFLKHQSNLDRVIDTTRNDINNFVNATKESKEFQAIAHTAKNVVSSAFNSIAGTPRVADDSDPASTRSSSPPEDWVHIAQDDDDNDDNDSRG